MKDKKLAKYEVKTPAKTLVQAPPALFEAFLGGG